ncbi:hypothetical protein [Streptacidiphilus jiangxiensis]|uniref:Uncharacterized protein n=1 Tax=Streptacidiphilus jiangxiensis TaxID=235985 RepID=A0A1H7WJ10_STRJI|nr:hypothetical protein [Streptacidiphilus jiangxiensis]SEM21471.1 hypothetical protein SAMN05414137_120196 [Streptacidiphilus jiangxiensis]
MQSNDEREDLGSSAAKPSPGHWLPTGCLGIGTVGTGSLAFTHARGWVIAVVVAVSAVCALLAALVPQESQHKVDWWRLILERRRTHVQFPDVTPVAAVEAGPPADGSAVDPSCAPASIAGSDRSRMPRGKPPRRRRLPRTPASQPPRGGPLCGQRTAVVPGGTSTGTPFRTASWRRRWASAGWARPSCPSDGHVCS